jgi:hypothetical protein
MQSFIFVMLWLKIFSSGETVQPLLSFSPKHKIRNKCYNFEWENWKRKMYNAAIPGVVITTIPIVVGVNGLNLVYVLWHKQLPFPSSEESHLKFKC